MKLTIRRLSSCPELTDEALALNDAVWPTFVDSTDAGIRFWEAVYRELPQFQFVAVTRDNRVAASGHTIPIYWDGTVEGLPVGWDDGLTQGMLRKRAQAPVNTLSGLAISIDPQFRGHNLGQRMIYEMKRLADEHQLRAFIGAVRPTLKCNYPWMPMEQYMAWRRDDGRAFDPWIRAHEAVGGRILGVARRSMVVEGTVSDWERWTGQSFPTSGPYAVPEALAPVHIDKEADRGLYEEPNVWMIHGAGAAPDEQLYPDD